MKFVHMADMHFDAPFTTLSSKGDLGEKRRLEQRDAFKKIIRYIKENDIEYFFISGDLYENEYVRDSTIEYINNLFKEIPNTKIYIAPGNHDPLIKNSMYSKFDWNNNVEIFGSEVKVIENELVDVYGYGFSDFYCKNSGIEEIEIKSSDKINILVIHGSLNGGSCEGMEYNPMNKNILKNLGFDYVALGHIHEPDYCTESGQRIIYPGSTISLGFDELGKHGIIAGEVSKENINLKFVPMDNKEFKELYLDISKVNSKEELIEKINELNIEEDTFYKIILQGDRQFQIDISYLYKLIMKENIIKIKDDTKIGINLEQIAKEQNLKGLFIKEVLENKELDNNKKEKIIEIGLEIFN